MKTFRHLIIILLLLPLVSCQNNPPTNNGTVNENDFAGEMVDFIPYKGNPVFQGSGMETWDKQIRERGYILFEDGTYKMWYSGYNGGDTVPKYLGYATSPDGIHWTRYAGNPVFSRKWTEDMYVIKNGGKYYMFAEGRNDIAHALISDDGIHWQEQGDLDIRTTKGESVPGPYGTPVVWIEHGKWYLFYERNDEAIWLAQSKDRKTWINVVDTPVIKRGPGKYDSGAVAANQVVKYNGKYYLYYHGSTNPDWATQAATTPWTSNVAVSTDLIHWVKYPKNPIVKGDHSSPILVFDGNKYRLYTMHPAVCLYLSRSGQKIN